MEEFQASKWQLLAEFIRNRLKNPKAHPEFFGYLAFVVIGMGGIGIWYALYHDPDKSSDHINVGMNMLSFSVSIVAAGCIELMFVQSTRLKNSLLIFSIILIGLFCLSFLIGTSFNDSSIYWFSVPTSMFALFIWWIANGENANLTDDFFDDQSDETKKLTDVIKQRHARRQ